MPNPLPLRRLVAELLERDPAAENMWTEPPGAPPYALHQLRVAQLALLVGRALELPASVLQDLGVAALYHDCGYAAGGSGSDGVGVPFERHGAAGARLMLRQRGFHEAKMRRVLAVLQHHRDANDRLHPGLFGRILRVAEDYDTLARRSGKLSPTMALAAMLKWAGTCYDAVLLQLLVNALGAYPPGTLLRLEDGRIVRSVAPARSAEAFARPLARWRCFPPTRATNSRCWRRLPCSPCSTFRRCRVARATSARSLPCSLRHGLARMRCTPAVRGMCAQTQRSPR